MDSTQLQARLLAGLPDWVSAGWLAAGVALIALMAASAWLRGLVARRFDDPSRRHGARQLVRFVTYVAALAIVFIAVGPNWPNLGVALGVMGAGLAFALQEVIASVAGWLAVLGGGFYRTGDRVMLGGIKGDVIEVGILRTTLMEVGEWVEGDNYSGRIVRIANSFVFKEPVFNYSADFQFVWDEIKLPIRYGSDLAKAEQTVLEAIAGELGAIGPATRQEWDKLVRKFRIENARLEPWVSVALTDNWISLSARFIVDYRARRSTKDRINRAILSAIDSSGGAVRIGTATMEVTSFRGD